jgi:hypothetical protein
LLVLTRITILFLPIYSLTYIGGLGRGGRGGSNNPRFGDFMLNNMIFSADDDDDEDMDSEEVVAT